jgi:two-component system sensor histidine kinase BarA
MNSDPETLPLIDPDDALERAGGRSEVAAELHGMLRESLSGTAGILRDAHEAGDLDRLRDTAHRLRGATLYCGVPRLRARVTEVERLCTEGDIDGLARALPRLLATTEAVRQCEDPLTAMH